MAGRMHWICRRGAGEAIALRSTNDMLSEGIEWRERRRDRRCSVREGGDGDGRWSSRGGDGDGWTAVDQNEWTQGLIRNGCFSCVDQPYVLVSLADRLKLETRHPRLW